MPWENSGFGILGEKSEEGSRGVLSIGRQKRASYHLFGKKGVGFIHFLLCFGGTRGGDMEFLCNSCYLAPRVYMVFFTSKRKLSSSIKCEISGNYHNEMIKNIFYEISLYLVW